MVGELCEAFVEFRVQCFSAIVSAKERDRERERKEKRCLLRGAYDCAIASREAAVGFSAAAWSPLYSLTRKIQPENERGGTRETKSGPRSRVPSINREDI